MKHNPFPGIVTMTCPVCNEKFDRITAEWSYRLMISGKVHYYCSYPCYSKIVGQLNAKVRKRKLRRKDKYEIAYLIHDGYDDYEIARILGLEESIVRNYRNEKGEDQP